MVHCICQIPSWKGYGIIEINKVQLSLLILHKTMQEINTFIVLYYIFLFQCFHLHVMYDSTHKNSKNGRISQK